MSSRRKSKQTIFLRISARASIPHRITTQTATAPCYRAEGGSRFWLVLLVGGLYACAPAMPALSGGETTPAQRVDLTLGGATRIVLGDFNSDKDDRSALSYAETGGISPLLIARFAVEDEVDLGLRLSGSAAQIEGRFGFQLNGELRIIGSVAPYLGWLPLRDSITDQKGLGFRYGVDTPWVLAFSAGGIYEAWTGICLSVDGASGSLDEEGDGTRFSGFGLRPGALIGFAVGFRRLYALIELTVNHEWWRFDQADTKSELSGFSFTPAFALRLRI
jgi:hypothetical protein